MIPTPVQCRAARGLLNMSRPELSRRSGVSLRALGDFEQGKSKLIRNNHEAIRETFEKAGVIFLGKTGVQLNDNEKSHEPEGS
jgi:transcriptional regulator with XRE-family HTH domain